MKPLYLLEAGVWGSLLLEWGGVKAFSFMCYKTVISASPCMSSSGIYQSLYVLVFKYCTRSLTQHSRPHTPDRLFSPILVEVLQRKKKKKRQKRVWDGGKFWGPWEASPVESFILFLPFSRSHGAQVTQHLHRPYVVPSPTPVLSHRWHFHTSDKNRARPHWAEMGGWIDRRKQVVERGVERSEWGRGGETVRGKQQERRGRNLIQVCKGQKISDTGQKKWEKNFFPQTYGAQNSRMNISHHLNGCICEKTLFFGHCDACLLLGSDLHSLTWDARFVFKSTAQLTSPEAAAEQKLRPWLQKLLSLKKRRWKRLLAHTHAYTHVLMLLQAFTESKSDFLLHLTKGLERY